MVEDTRVPHPEGGPDDLHWVRRMVFLSTRGLTQSEAYLAHRPPEASDAQVRKLLVVYVHSDILCLKALYTTCVKSLPSHEALQV